MKILSAKNPKYTANGNIDLTVYIKEIGTIPFSASPHDIEEHGRELYARAASGEFGKVAPHVVDVEVLRSAKKAEVEGDRDAECCANVTALGIVWQADHKSQELLTRALLLAQVGGSMPATWRSADNTDLEIVDVSQLVEIANAISAQTDAAYRKSWKRKKALAAATKQAQIEAV